MDAPPLLRMQGISKQFGATRALSDVSLDIWPGQVLALVGENGAGKSTLMKILSGAHRSDSGSMLLEGQPYAPSGPHEARLAGVAMIYQELNLAADLSVEDNIMLGREQHRGGVLQRKRQRQLICEVLRRLGHPELNPDTKVGRLPVGAQQVVEIARALAVNARVIVFDEPTSSLPSRDVVRLFGVIKKLRESGIGVIYISHFLEEVREVADSYEVLRDGRQVGQGQLEEVDDAQIVAMMVGRTVDELFPRVPHELGEVVMQIDGLSGMTSPRDVNLKLRRGEILGVAGLVGAGRTELLRCLFGLDAVRGGNITVAGRVATGGPRSRMQIGLGLLSEDRKVEGLAQQLSINDNMTLSRLRPYARAGWLRLGARANAVQRWMEQLNIKARHSEAQVQDLSGGNQQKVAMARVLHEDAEILLLDEPTRGIDVATKSEIYRLMGNLAAQGKAIIFVSSYLPELLAICDRVAVLSRGRLRDVRPANEWTEQTIMEQAIAAESAASDKAP